jgi:hypothetical protein
MAKFFKTFANGILYVLLLPILVVGLAISAAISLIVFVIIGLKAIILFFKGENMFGDLPEDIEAKARLEAMSRAAQGQLAQAQQPPVQGGNTIVIQNLNAVIAPRKNSTKGNEGFFFEDEDISAIEQTIASSNLIENKEIVQQIETIENQVVIDETPIAEKKVEQIDKKDVSNKSHFFKVGNVPEEKIKDADLDITYEQKRKGER